MRLPKLLEIPGIAHGLMSEHGLDIEEAHFTTISLPHNLKFRGGKFRSDFGLLNHQHRHHWDFCDMVLVYLAFVGSHGINEVGGTTSVDCTDINVSHGRN